MTYLRTTPVDVILGNHIYVLVQLATVQLLDGPPNLANAQLVIDLVAAMLNTGGDRLGDNVSLYREALANLQQVYVRAATAVAG